MIERQDRIQAEKESEFLRLKEESIAAEKMKS